MWKISFQNKIAKNQDFAWVFWTVVMALQAGHPDGRKREPT